MKLAKILWVIASFYFLVVGIIYIFVLNDAPIEGPERLDYIKENGVLYMHQWKAEFLIATFLTISSFLFAGLTKNSGFTVIAVGQLLVATAFPISIGSTVEASYELYQTLSEAMRTLITFGMVFSLGGFMALYARDRVLNKWLRMAALGISSISILIFGAGFLGIIKHSSAHKAMLIVMLLYAINGYYGIKLSSNPPASNSAQ